MLTTHVYTNAYLQCDKLWQLVFQQSLIRTNALENTQTHVYTHVYLQCRELWHLVFQHSLLLDQILRFFVPLLLQIVLLLFHAYVAGV